MVVERERGTKASPRKSLSEATRAVSVRIAVRVWRWIAMVFVLYVPWLGCGRVESSRCEMMIFAGFGFILDFGFDFGFD